MQHKILLLQMPYGNSYEGPKKIKAAKTSMHPRCTHLIVALKLLVSEVVQPIIGSIA